MIKKNLLLTLVSISILLSNCVAISNNVAISNDVAKEIYVSPTGNDANLGTKNNPYLSFEKALEEVKKYAGKEGVTVWFHAGEYYLKETIEIGSEYSETVEHPVLFSPYFTRTLQKKGYL